MFGPIYTVDQQTIYKPYTDTSLPALADMLSKPTNRKYAEAGKPLTISVEDARQQYLEKDATSPNSVVWGIFNQERVLQGRTGFFQGQDNKWYTSVFIDENFKGQGLQKKTLAMRLVHATREMKIPLIYTIIRVENRPSMHNVEQAGFVQIDLKLNNFTSRVDGKTYNDAILVWINPKWTRETSQELWHDDLKKALEIKPDILEITESYLRNAETRIEKESNEMRKEGLSTGEGTGSMLS